MSMTSRPGFWVLVTTFVMALALIPVVASAQGDAEGGDSTTGESSGETPAVDAVGTPTGGEAGTLADTPIAEENAGDPLLDAVEPEDRSATDQRLREIGNQVDILKEDTFATKSRLLLLRESVLRRTIAGSKVVVIHSNEMGSEYQLVQVRYSLDGDSKWERLDHTGKLDGMSSEVVIDEKVVPGSHGLVVQMVYKGSDWGIFRYMDGYEYSLTSSYVFNADEGMAQEIVVRAYEKGGFFTALEDRPNIQFEMTEHDLDQPSAAVANKSEK